MAAREPKSVFHCKFQGIIYFEAPPAQHPLRMPAGKKRDEEKESHGRAKLRIRSPIPSAAPAERQTAALKITLAPAAAAGSTYGNNGSKQRQ
jgi:hypothetical protein